MCPVDYIAFAVSGKVGIDPYTDLTTPVGSLSSLQQAVMEVFWGVSVLSLSLWSFLWV